MENSTSRYIHFGNEHHRFQPANILRKQQALTNYSSNNMGQNALRTITKNHLLNFQPIFIIDLYRNRMQFFIRHNFFSYALHNCITPNLDKRRVDSETAHSLCKSWVLHLEVGLLVWVVGGHGHASMYCIKRVLKSTPFFSTNSNGWPQKHLCPNLLILLRKIPMFATPF